MKLRTGSLRKQTKLISLVKVDWINRKAITCVSVLFREVSTCSAKTFFFGEGIFLGILGLLDEREMVMEKN